MPFNNANEKDRETALRAAQANNGKSLWELSEESTLLVIFLRHFGCTFCKEAVRDAARQRADIQAGGATIVFVHTDTEENAKRFFEDYGMEDVPRISNPSGDLYEAFGLDRAGLREMLSPSVWFRGISAIAAGNLPGRPRGDVLRMPGAFVVKDGKIAKSYLHRTIAERPNIAQFSQEGLAACRH